MNWQAKAISKYSLQEIRKVKLAEHYQIPTLEETLDLCHNRIKLMLELKLVNSLDLFLEIVNAGMKPGELFITSFYPNLVNNLADFAPQIATRHFNRHCNRRPVSSNGIDQSQNNVTSFFLCQCRTGKYLAFS